LEKKKERTALNFAVSVLKGSMARRRERRGGAVKYGACSGGEKNSKKEGGLIKVTSLNLVAHATRSKVPNNLQMADEQ